jgi:hypothetical protein
MPVVSFAMAEKDSSRSAFQDEAVGIYGAFGFTPTSTSASLDPKDSSYGFVVGWRLTEHIALEGGYMDLGTVAYKDRSTGPVRQHATAGELGAEHRDLHQRHCAFGAGHSAPQLSLGNVRARRRAHRQQRGERVHYRRRQQSEASGRPRAASISSRGLG